MKWLELDAVMAKTTLSRSYIMASRNDFPKGHKIPGKRDLVWIESEVDAWMAAQVDQSRAA